MTLYTNIMRKSFLGASLAALLCLSISAVASARNIYAPHPTNRTLASALAPPHINSHAPTGACPGTLLALTGGGFASNMTVYFMTGDGVESRSPYGLTTATLAHVIVPADAVGGFWVWVSMFPLPPSNHVGVPALPACNYQR